MSHSSRFFIAIAFLTSISCMSHGHINLEEVLKNIHDSAPGINWTVEQVNKYHVPAGIIAVGIAKAGFEKVTQTRVSFVLSSLFGAMVVSEGIKVTSHNYLQLRKAQESGAQKLITTVLKEADIAKDTVIEAKNALVEKTKVEAAEVVKAIEEEIKK